IEKTGVVALRALDNELLQKAIAAAITQHHANDPQRIARKSGGFDYILTVSPLTVRSGLFSPSAPVAQLQIIDPDARVTSESQLAKLFGLSAAQTRLTGKLLQGMTLDESATALGIAVPTARTHLAEIFRKTHTSRQTELIRLLMSVG